MDDGASSSTISSEAQGTRNGRDPAKTPVVLIIKGSVQDVKKMIQPLHEGTGDKASSSTSGSVGSHLNNDKELAEIQVVLTVKYSSQDATNNQLPASDSAASTEQNQNTNWAPNALQGEMRSRRTRLYHAAKTGDWKTAEEIFGQDQELLNSAITDTTRETVFHVAAGANQVEFVKKLVEKTDLDFNKRDGKGNTAFCTAAIVGASEIIKILRPLNNGEFISLRGGANMTPLYIAALFGNNAIALDLYHESRQYLHDDDKIWLFFACIHNEIFDLALSLLNDYRPLHLHLELDGQQEERETALHVLARKPSAFASQGLWKRLINKSPWFGSSSHTSLQTQALKLLKELISRVSEESWDTIIGLFTKPQNLLLEAAELGNYGFLDLLIQSFPGLVWVEDEKNNHTIFHVAILKRRLNILKVIRETGLCKNVIQAWEDNHKNNILHLASSLPTPDILNNVSGEALQMQQELLFFKEVENLFPPLYRNKRNSDKRTPKELFSQRHNELMKEGEKWMKKNAASCLLVATLIVTVVYPATFTIPGGNNNISNVTSTSSGGNNHETAAVLGRKYNIPAEPINILLAIVNTIAMASSTMSIMMFFSILISRYLEEDFIFSLLFKFKFGLISLFVSLLTMMASFCIATVINYVRYGPEWVYYFIFSSPSLPTIALIFFLLCPLLRRG